MEGSEELRETLVGMRRELDMLQTETAHANVLLRALDALLCVDGDADPFAGVFSDLLPIFKASHAIVLIQEDNDENLLECAASNAAALVGSRWKSSSLIAKVLSGRIVTTLSTEGTADWPPEADACLERTQSALYLPLAVRDRRGLLMLLRESGYTGFDRSHVTLARKFSVLASHAFAARNAHQTEAESTRLKQLADQLRVSQEALAFRANHDQLTGLPNRARIQELVDEALARKSPGEKLALAFIDLDDFKRVNDFHGHAAGDALLKGVADRIRGEIRKTDILGRISGDEFVIVLDPFNEEEEIVALVGRIRDRLQAPFEIEGFAVDGTGSIGVAFFPAHGRDYETLRRNADTAMYQAKLSSKGSVEFFSQELGRKLADRISLERRLRAAFDDREFKCVLQAKVDIHTREIVGFEALVRWVDRNGVVHAPGYFLKSANELGLLDGIANIVLDELIAKLPRLDACFGDGLRYSINVSPAQAATPVFMRALAEKISATGRSRSFMLELTEESLLAAGVFQSEILPLLREKGIGISIDDFGTGYSSLSTLADITADELKFDRSFIRAIHQRPRSQSILRAVESLSAALGIDLVAEGIETDLENDYLKNKTRIRVGQGYLFHAPQFIDDIIAEHATLVSVPEPNGEHRATGVLRPSCERT